MLERDLQLHLPADRRKPERLVRLICDGHGDGPQRYFPRKSEDVKPAALRARAAKQGWSFDGQHDFCPEHAR